MKVHIATSRAIGRTCAEWAAANLPSGVELTSDPELSDVFISVMYGHLVSEEFIAKRRCYNFHPGILPQYRGAGAFSWAIINGDKKCGITLHEMDVDIDTGPVLQISDFAIEAWDTAETLFDKGMTTIFELFKIWFPYLTSPNKPTGTAQDRAQGRTYYRKDLQAARDLTRYVRAFAFEGKDPVFYVDSAGRKIELRW